MNLAGKGRLHKSNLKINLDFVKIISRYYSSYIIFTDINLDKKYIV
ncbi:hypothetical protein NIES4071_60840 [Calothrix sp. NIES-4071]|nr:hypothetical protein NIES4071_60840 [Calothrix sp. NIES-4071]BAZ60391.1 hypothetical protein NIES4105_60790 [Calothrix sp. NIES-4105]